MKLFLLSFVLLLNFTPNLQAQSKQKVISLFDGNTFSGWEGDTINTWRIIDHVIVGGSLSKKVPRNEFLCSKESYGDFEFSLQFKLLGRGTDLINAGVQFHSKRLPNPGNEMIGYQADIGDGFWGSLYDEYRRNVVIVNPDSLLIKKILKPNNWNSLRIRSTDRRIRIWLNEAQTVDYTEPDERIIHYGRFGIQVRGGGITLVQYKNIKVLRL